jgi:hypothetical protein
MGLFILLSNGVTPFHPLKFQSISKLTILIVETDKGDNRIE